MPCRGLSPKKIETWSKWRNLSQFDISPTYLTTERKKLGIKKGTSFWSACEKCAVHNLSCRAARMQRLERGTRLRAEEASLVGFTICHQAEERRGMQSTLATTQKPFSRQRDPPGKVRKKFLLRAAKVRQTPRRGGSMATAWRGVQGSIFDALFQGTRTDGCQVSVIRYRGDNEKRCSTLTEPQHLCGGWAPEQENGQYCMWSISPVAHLPLKTAPFGPMRCT